jgi:hypothetical protein
MGGVFFQQPVKPTTEAPQSHVIGPDTVSDQLEAILMRIAFFIPQACRGLLTLFCNSCFVPGLAQPGGSVYRWQQA